VISCLILDFSGLGGRKLEKLTSKQALRPDMNALHHLIVSALIKQEFGVHHHQIRARSKCRKKPTRDSTTVMRRVPNEVCHPSPETANGPFRRHISTSGVCTQAKKTQLRPLSLANGSLRNPEGQLRSPTCWASTALQLLKHLSLANHVFGSLADSVHVYMHSGVVMKANYDV